MDFGYHSSLIFEWLLLILFNDMDLTSSWAIQRDIHKEYIRCFSDYVTDISILKLIRE